MPATAPVLWAQRKDSLYITLNLPDVEKDSVKIDLQPTKLTFR
jgi:HSP20 family molecular chaperone IbpA